MRRAGSESPHASRGASPPPVSLDSMIDWQDWEYRPVNSRLVVGGSVAESELRSVVVESIEATIETLLAFNLPELVGLPLQLVRRAYPMEPSADIVATDPLRRVHLFELKKDKVSGEAAAQLEQYLLRHVFGDADQYLADAATHGESQAGRSRLGRDIVGVWANERMGTQGYKKIVRELGETHPMLNPGGRRFTQYRWDKSGSEDQLELIHAALAIHGQKRGLTMPPLDEIVDTAGMWEQRLANSAFHTETRLIAERRIVVWLVGARIDPKALERVRLWRRAGIDARVLELTATSNGEKWMLGVRREAAPQRDQTEQGLFSQAADLSQPATRVKVAFYDERPPSENSRHGGGLLDNPIVKFR